MIYQNADYVEAILQELLDSGLVQWSESENTYKAAEETSAGGQISGDAVPLPMFLRSIVIQRRLSSTSLIEKSSSGVTAFRISA